MDQLRIVRVVGAAICVALLAGCADAPPEPHARPGSSPGQSRASSATAVPAVAGTVPPRAIALSSAGAPSNETVLGQLSSQRGTNELGPFAIAADQAFALYAVCVGSGVVDVSIPNVGSFLVHCDPTGRDSGLKNEFRLGVATVVTARAEGDDSLLWGLAVTAVS